MEGNLSANGALNYLARKPRTQALVEGDPSLALSIASEVESVLPVQVVSPAKEELVMLQVRESARNSLFYLAEALLCSCRVRVGEKTGYGYCLGQNRALATALAVIDGAFNWASEQPDFSSSELVKKFDCWNNSIICAADKLTEKAAFQQKKIDSTRVEFFAMDGE